MCRTWLSNLASGTESVARREGRIYRLMISYVAVDSSGMPIIQKNALERLVWMQSTAKRIQLLPFLDRGLHQKYALTKEEVVVLASSHLAQPQHVGALLSIFRKAELKEEDMVLPPSAPQGKRSYQAWI